MSTPVAIRMPIYQDCVVYKNEVLHGHWYMCRTS